MWLPPLISRSSWSRSPSVRAVRPSVEVTILSAPRSISVGVEIAERAGRKSPGSHVPYVSGIKLKPRACLSYVRRRNASADLLARATVSALGDGVAAGERQRAGDGSSWPPVLPRDTSVHPLKGGRACHRVTAV